MNPNTPSNDSPAFINLNQEFKMSDIQWDGMPNTSNPENYPATPMEKQVGGTHYKNLAIQPAEYVFKNGIGYLEGNVIKYISRHEAKGGAEDVLKAIHYCEMVLQMRYGITK